MWDLDGKQIQLSLEAIVANREVVAARVFGEDGQFVAEARDPAVTTDVTDTLTRDVARQSASGNERIIGRLEVEITNGEIWAQTRDRLVWRGLSRFWQYQWKWELLCLRCDRS